ncbi:hypothetical protein ACS5PN_26525 [Roseateles sp. NT4]|uniref:hypothetical protein n=1 Tax=Roseateles sp. NT4 TaxID=3453715 RepID=UPI003EEF411E
MSQFQESEVRMLLMTCPEKKTSELAKDTALVKSLTKVFNATLEIAKDQPTNGSSLAMALSKKGLAISGVAATATGSEELKAANFVATQTLKTVGLMKLASMTPTKASIYLTIAMTEKVVSAAGLASLDKCKMAIASLSATTGAGALTCFASGAFTMGIGCVAGAIAVAADAFDVYGQCYGQGDKPDVDSSLTSVGRMP